METIKLLLESTGLTPDELISKIAEYKLITNNNSTNKNQQNQEEEELLSSETNDKPNSNYKLNQQSTIISNCSSFCEDEVIEILDDEDEIKTEKVDEDESISENQHEREEENYDSEEEIDEENYDNGDETEEENYKNEDEKEEENYDNEDKINEDINDESDKSNSTDKPGCIDDFDENPPDIDAQVKNSTIKNSPDSGTITEEMEFVEKRGPKLGCLRKRNYKGGTRKIIRSSRNPSFIRQESSSSTSSSGGEEEEESDAVELAETYKGDNVIAELSKQILQLRSKKPRDLNNTFPIMKTYARRNQPSSLDLNMENSKNESLLNIKIVEVRGGVTDTGTSVLDRTSVNMEKPDYENNDIPGLDDVKEINDKKIFSFKIINEELSSKPIRITKTYNYKDIKGWRRKKFLINAIYDDEKYKQFVETCNIYNSDPKCSYVKLKEESNECKIESSDDTKKINNVKDCKIAEVLTNNLNENESVDNCKDISSVFLGSSLDGFLKNELNSKFSTHIKKALSDVQNIESKFDPNLAVQYYNTSAKDKPKTLIKNDDPNRPRTLAEKRKLLEMSKLEPKSKIIKVSPEKSLPSDACYSYITWAGKKLKIPTKYKKDVNVTRHYKIKPKTFYESKETNLRHKPSIYIQPKQVKVGYRAGPLCKKPFMQYNNVNNWRTVIKDLPKIELTVYPTCKTPIHPRVKQFVKFDSWEIDSTRAEFAVSAAATESDSNEKKPFTFFVPYSHNQSKILLREKIKFPVIQIEDITEITSTKPEESEEERTTEIKAILSDLIRAVEVKEIENSIIKDDPDSFSINDVPLQEFETDKNLGKRQNKKNILFKGKKGLKHNELKRLNVKIIELNVEEDVETEKECQNEFCKYGCVCKSIAGHGASDGHCGNMGCIFGCVCGYDNNKSQVFKLSVPPGIDLLSDKTVNRLQSVVTKDLAKIEKQFTQTIIHANNQTIVVGDTLDRKKRTSRCPNKYKDYIETNFIEEIENCSDDNLKEVLLKAVDKSSIRKRTKESFINKECRILLHRLNLQHVYPFCLEHNLYECHCNFNAPYTKKSTLKEVNAFKKADVEKVETSKKTGKKRKLSDAESKEVPAKGKSKISVDVEKDEVLTCARLKPVFSDVYKLRNKNPGYKQGLVRRLKLDSVLTKEWINANNENKQKVLIIKSTLMPASTEPKEEKQIPTIPASIEPKEEKQSTAVPVSIEPKEEKQTNTKSNRRKQVLEIRKEDTSQIAKQTPPETKVVTKKKQTNVSAEELSFVPHEAFMEKFSQIFSKSYGDSTPRMLPWNYLISCYEKRQLKIWCHTNGSKSRFILTSNDIQSIPSFKNIIEYEKFESKENIQVDLIRWVVTRKLPDAIENNSDNMFVIISKKLGLWEICGICTKKPECERTLNTSDEIINIEEIEETTSPNEKVIANNKFEGINYRPVMNLNEFKPVEEVVFAHNKFSVKILTTIESELTPNKKKSVSMFCAGLPSVGSGCKWRMLALAKKFDLLSFGLNTFCIKYIDLQTIMNVALKHEKTIIINTKDISKNYSHTLYGIYVVPQYNDRVFIGPYLISESHNLKTLNIKSQHKTRKYMINSHSGVWIQQIEQLPDTLTSIIDLTEQEEIKKKKMNTKSFLRKNIPPIIGGNNSTCNKSEELVTETVKPIIICNGDEKSAMFNTLVSNGLPKSILKGRPNLEIIAYPANQDDIDKTNKNSEIKLPFNPILINAMKSLDIKVPEGSTPIFFKFNFIQEVVFGCKTPKGVMVLWPQCDNAAYGIKQFLNVNVASEWLRLEMDSCFIKMPSSFEINVSVVSDEICHDHQCLPMEYILGCYIIGDFGIVKIMDVISLIKKYKDNNKKLIKDIKFNRNFNHTEFINLLTDFVKIEERDGESPFVRELRNKLKRCHSNKSELKNEKQNLLKTYISLVKKFEISDKKYVSLTSEDEDITVEDEVVSIESDDDESRDSSSSEDVEEVKADEANKEASNDSVEENKYKRLKIVNGNINHVGLSAKLIPIAPIKKPTNTFTLLSESLPSKIPSVAPPASNPTNQNADKVIEINTPLDDKKIPNIKKIKLTQFPNRVVLKLLKNENCTKAVKLLPSQVEHLKFLPKNKTLVIAQKVPNDT